MNIIELIEKKKNNLNLSKEELEFIVNGYVEGSVTDYQMSSFLMAVCINGLSDEETTMLTSIYIDSGDVVDFENRFKHIADKHSTGGVGDKTSLIVGPLVASCGVVMAKMSGRGLGHTGGTIDKLESVTGFKTELSEEEFVDVVSNNNIAIIGQTKDLVVADKKIYALRDVSGTVDSIALISASIMSKKLACGSDNILIDVKVGAGALMDTYERSVELAKSMVKIGKAHGKNTVAVLSDMNQPLGYTVGNKLEVIEAYNFLDGDYAADLYELCVTISAKLVSLCLEISMEDATKMVCEKLESKEALRVFKTFITSQGGDLNSIEKSYDDVKVSNRLEILSDYEGYITDINALEIANIARDLGAGRIKKSDVIDNNVGIVLCKKVNDYVNVKDVLAVVYFNEKGTSNLEEKVKKSYKFDSKRNEMLKVIYDII